MSFPRNSHPNVQYSDVECQATNRRTSDHPGRRRAKRSLKRAEKGTDREEHEQPVMAITGGGKARGRGGGAWLVLVLVLVLVLACAVAARAASEESSFVVSRHRGAARAGIVGRGGAVPCADDVEMRRDGYLKQRVASADGAIAMATGPCIRQATTSCPVKCFRADPVCGTDKVTYWCGAADANCAGVEVAHDGYCNLWESNTNIGSSTAVQSLQLVHMLWLVVAGIFVVLGLL